MSMTTAARATLIGLACMTPACVLAQDAAPAEVPVSPESADLHPMLERVRAAHDLVAVGAIVLERGEVRAIGVAGMRQKGGASSVEPTDPWHLGSCTKAMTATLAARLVERGDISWDTTIADALAEDLGAEIHPGFRDVTLAQLVRNVGGCSTAVEPALWGRLWMMRDDPERARRTLTEETITRAPPVAVGDYEYSNTGFAIAGHMLETVTGTPWEDLMRTEVFEPLGIEHAGFGHPGAPGDTAVPWGHDARRGAIPPGPLVDNPPAIGPAGTVHMPLADWARFVAVHLGPGNGAPEDFLSDESLATLRDVQGPGSYAAGWIVARRPWAGPGGLVLTHSGSNNAWYCVAWLAPERDLAILVTCNEGDAAAPTDQIAGELVRRMTR